MKNFERLTYYDILKIPPNSSSFEIKRAYRDALSIYNEDSLVTYSLFSSDERDKILKTIEEAFLTLINENKRAAYDRVLADSGQVDLSITSMRNQKKPVPFYSSNITDIDNFAERVRKKSREQEVKKLTNETLSKDLISGDDLKKVREAVDVEISEINAITRISVSVIKSIEGNQFESLPPELYLRNFLRTYAETLKIDPQRIIDGYLKNISLAQKK
jgi:curved DNA-binding protein CbpA